MLHLRSVHKQLKDHHKLAVKRFNTTHRHAKRLLRKHRIPLEKLRGHATRTVALAGVAAASAVGPVFAATQQPAPPPDPSFAPFDLTRMQPTTAEAFGPAKAEASQKGLFVKKVQEIIPHPEQGLNATQEQQLIGLVSEQYGLNVKTELNGIRLNMSYGVAAKEQNLPLYHGDHRPNLTPGTGAWGYFANSKKELTPLDVQREANYGVVQTWLAPGFDKDVAKYKDFFHHRPMLFINPVNGKAWVVAIEDAGPNPSLHRAFGMAPAVADGLEIGSPAPIFALFLDDPSGSIPLGSVAGGAQ